MIGARIDKLQFLASQIDCEMVTESDCRYGTSRVFAPLENSGGLFLSDDLNTWREQRRRADVIGVFVAVDQIANRRIGHLANRVEIFLAKRRQRIDSDDSILRYEEHRVVSAIADPIKAVFDLLDRVTFIRSLSASGRE